MSSSIARVVTGRRDLGPPFRHAAKDAREGGGPSCAV